MLFRDNQLYESKIENAHLTKIKLFNLLIDSIFHDKMLFITSYPIKNLILHL
jgi:hypothetical protein